MCGSVLFSPNQKMEKSDRANPQRIYCTGLAALAHDLGRSLCFRAGKNTLCNRHAIGISSNPWGRARSGWGHMGIVACVVAGKMARTSVHSVLRAVHRSERLDWRRAMRFGLCMDIEGLVGAFIDKDGNLIAEIEARDEDTFAGVIKDMGVMSVIIDIETQH